MHRSIRSAELAVVWFALLLVLFLALGLGLFGCAASEPTPSVSDDAVGAPTSDDSTLPTADNPTLLMYAGSASKPPTEEAIQLFEQKTGIKVQVVFGGSGTVLSQMKLSREGDLYFPGSSDFMEKAKTDGDVVAATEARVVYLVPAINVQRGNPKNIHTLADLTRPGVTVAIANPETVCVGLYAVEIIERSLSATQKAAFRDNLLNYTESCEKTATAISLKQVDAVLGWSVFEHWNPEAIETVPLAAAQVTRIGYIPIAVASYTRHQAAAQSFIDFLISAEGQAVFAKHGYFTTPQQAFQYLGEEKPVGGEYVLPSDWVNE